MPPTTLEPGELTPRQKKILEYMRKYIRRHLVSPSIVEVAKFLRIPKATAWDAMEALEREGFIRRPRGRRRSWTLVDDDPRVSVVRGDRPAPSA